MLNYLRSNFGKAAKGREQMVKLIAIDMDGTLLKSDKTLTSATMLAIHNATRHGIEVALATGRSPEEFSHYLKLLPTVRYAVTCTGSRVMDCRTSELLAHFPLTGAELREVYARVSPFDGLFEVFCDGTIYVDADKDIDYYMKNTCSPVLEGTRMPREGFADWIETMDDTTASKVHMYFRESAERDAAWDALRGVDAFVCCSEAYDLEILHRGVDKGSGLSYLASYLDIPREAVLAIGDSGNDVGMLTYAGISAVMGNASDELKEIADIVTDTNDADGVSILLHTLVSGQLDPRVRGKLH